MLFTPVIFVLVLQDRMPLPVLVRDEATEVWQPKMAVSAPVRVGRSDSFLRRKQSTGKLRHEKVWR